MATGLTSAFYGQTLSVSIAPKVPARSSTYKLAILKNAWESKSGPVGKGSGGRLKGPLGGNLASRLEQLEVKAKQAADAAVERSNGASTPMSGRSPGFLSNHQARLQDWWADHLEDRAAMVQASSPNISTETSEWTENAAVKSDQEVFAETEVSKAEETDRLDEEKAAKVNAANDEKRVELNSWAIGQWKNVLAAVEDKHTEAMDKNRAELGEWAIGYWKEQLAIARKEAGVKKLEVMDATRAELGEWAIGQWKDELAVAQKELAEKRQQEMDAVRLELGEWAMARWKGELEIAEKEKDAKRQEAYDAIRVELGEWAIGRWNAELAIAEKEQETKRQEAYDAIRVELGEWAIGRWKEELAIAEAKRQEANDVVRVELGEWAIGRWKDELAIAEKEHEAKRQEAMDAARADLGLWAIQQWKAELAAAEKEQKERKQLAMDESRVELGEWAIGRWMAELMIAEKEQGERLQQAKDAARTDLGEWAIGRWKAELAAAEKELEESQQLSKDAARAETRERKEEKVEAQQAPSAPEAEEPAAQSPSAVEEEDVGSDDLEAVVEAGAVSKVLSLEEEVIARELAIEKAKRARKAAEREKDLLRYMEKQRAAMRSWWTSTWGAKKQSLGWSTLEKCWLLRPEGQLGGADSIEITGEGVTVGMVPTVEEGFQPFVLNAKGVSFTHASLYGKEKSAGAGKIKREYFIKDLGSTNGTFLNSRRLASNVEVKLTPGDVVKFGGDAAVFTVEIP